MFGGVYDTYTVIKICIRTLDHAPANPFQVRQFPTSDVMGTVSGARVRVYPLTPLHELKRDLLDTWMDIAQALRSVELIWPIITDVFCYSIKEYTQLAVTGTTMLVVFRSNDVLQMPCAFYRFDGSLMRQYLWPSQSSEEKSRLAPADFQVHPEHPEGITNFLYTFVSALCVTLLNRFPILTLSK